MSVPFVAMLRTERVLERGVSYHGVSQTVVEKMAQGWLDIHGEHGDSFSIMEYVPTQRAVLECSKPLPAPVEPKWRTHVFVVGKNPGRCDTCGNDWGNHLSPQ